MTTTASTPLTGDAGAIPQPDPSTTPDELVERARALRPLLRASQIKAQELGRVAPEVQAELEKAGFFRILQPRRFGGYEFDVTTFFRVMIELSRGCTETGWVTCLVGGHTMMINKYPAETQVGMYGTTGEVRCPGSFAPPGTAKRVEGGYRVTGGWRNASGCDISTHFMPLVLLAGVDKPTPMQIILDRDQYDIVDDWDVVGMRATGSKKVVSNDVFVPENRAIFVAGMERGAEPLRSTCSTSDNPIFQTLVGPFLVGELAAVAVGAGRAALDHFEENLRTAKASYPPYNEKFRDPIAQQHYGTAFRLIATAEAALLRSGDDYARFAREAVAGTHTFDEEREMTQRLISLEVVQRCWEAFDLLFQTGGTSMSARRLGPMERLLRNFAVLRTHIVLQLDNAATLTGRLRFGLPR